MSPDTVTAGGWALTVACLIITAAIIAGLWRHAGHIARGAIAEQALAAALHARDQDIDQLKTAAGLPPDEFDQEWREWQARQ